MTQQTMSEKDMYLASFEHEFQTSLKVLKGYPSDKLDLTPADRLKSARELAWMLVLNQKVVEPILNGELMPGQFPPAPATLQEIIAAFEQAHRDSTVKLAGLTEGAMNGPVRMPTGPKQVGEMRRGNALWMMLNDTIHHRGQFSVFSRIAGGRVPSIYGPSADEPWS